MICSDAPFAVLGAGVRSPRVVRALSVGPAASHALSAGGGTLRVHSVFSSTVNLEADGTGRFVSLCAPRGGSFPHAVALDRAEDFLRWGLALGSPAWVADGHIQLSVECGAVVVDLRQAEPSPPRALPAIHRLGSASRACTLKLARIQRNAICDLRIDGLPRAGAATTAVHATLREATLALGAATVHRAPLRETVAALVGLGAGLTPSGDDVLCGFMAAARASCHALMDALNDAAEENIGRTNAISGFLIRCAIEGFWPTPLVTLAEALSRDHETDSLAALGELCKLGHSSGSDIATGFLLGLEALGSRATAHNSVGGGGAHLDDGPTGGSPI